MTRTIAFVACMFLSGCAARSMSQKQARELKKAGGPGVHVETQGKGKIVYERDIHHQHTTARRIQS